MCLIAFPLGGDLRQKVINVSIVATIVSRGKARGRGETLEIVFVMFKHSQRRVKREEGVRGEKILNIAAELSDTDLLHNMLPLPE